MSRKEGLSVEEVPPGPLPKWVLDHAVNQAKLSLTKSENSKILFIHPNQASRSEVLDTLSGSVPVFDRSAHHTIHSLARVIGEDLRIKRPIQVDPVLDESIHMLAIRAAETLRFPILHPDNKRKWHRGKTEAIRGLHNALLSEDLLHSWDGAHEALEFKKILEESSKPLGGLHPDLFILEVIEQLENENQDTPFTLEGMDGILMLDHDPTLPNLELRFIRSLLRYVPIHQLSHTGSYRLGEHGLQIEDIFPVDKKEELPSWIPVHIPSSTRPSPEPHEIPIRLERQTVATVAQLMKKKREHDPYASIIIIDPSWAKREHVWNRCVSSIRSMIDPNIESNPKNPILTSLISDMTIAIGSRGFSLEKTRELGKRGIVFELFETPAHPEDPEIIPIFHPDLLEASAIKNHIVGGQGSLVEWLKSLSTTSDDDRDSLRREQTQWWMLIVASNLSPLLSREDRESLRNPIFRRGCMSGVDLPLPLQSSNANDWLGRYLQIIEARGLSHDSGASANDCQEAVEYVTRRMRKFEMMTRSLDFEIATSGEKWVERTQRILSGFKRKNSNVRDPNIRIMTPKQALGCTADLVLLTHLSTEWSMQVKKPPYLSEQERLTLGISSPDNEIKSARHSMQHLLNAAPEVYVIHATNDDLAHPSFILDEWLSQRPDHDPKYPEIKSEPHGPRDRLISDGRRILSGEPASRKPLSGFGPLLKLNLDLVNDIASRSPTIPDSDGFLPDSSAPWVTTPPIKDIANPTSKAKRNPPRTNGRWPVIGARNTKFVSATVDPRPTQGWKTDIQQRESRQGHTGIRMNRKKWSPYRLNNWLECPRKGWLTDKQNLSEDERTSQDLDSRTYGNILHGIHHDVMFETLGLKEGEECTLNDLHSRKKSIKSSKHNQDEVMMIALTSLSKRAPWLTRSNATCTQKLWMLTGMNTDEWETWLANPKPIKSNGRVGSMIDAEMRTDGSAPIAIEWALSKNSPKIDIEIPNELVENHRKIVPFTATGVIDRVDLVPFDEQGEKWHDDEGSNQVAPLRLFGSGWKPRRMVIIRDLKSREDFEKPRDRHERALFGELQLALYSRAWELSHPGDLVVGAGITTLGFDSNHYIEASGLAPSWVLEGGFGEATSLTRDMFRFADEGPDTKSDHFRAWLTHRMTVASSVVHNANLGFYNPTPDPSICRYCKVSSVCDQGKYGGQSA